MLTLKVVTFPIHEDVIDHDYTKDASPKMNIAEHKHKANILGGKRKKKYYLFIYFYIHISISIYISIYLSRNVITGIITNKIIINLTYIECIEEDEQWNLDHADLHSNATSHFKAAKRGQGRFNILCISSTPD